MDLLLLLYAMIAGLAGVNAGPSTVARLSTMAQRQVVAERSAGVPQATVAVRALASRVAMAVVRPAEPVVDARRVPAAISATPPVSRGRAAPERRLE